MPVGNTMNLSLDANELAIYLAAQLSAFFPDRTVAATELDRAVSQALPRLEYCFSRIGRKYYSDTGQTYFNHLNTDHYAAFLYLVSNSLHREDADRTLAEKVYALNKALHGLDLYFEVSLPEVFMLVHPVGTVIGRGTFGNFFCCYHNCTIGSSLEGVYPVLGEGVVLFGGSKVIGESKIGDNCCVAPGTTIIDTDIPADSVIHGMPPETAWQPTRRNVIRDVFLFER